MALIDPTDDEFPRGRTTPTPPPPAPDPAPAPAPAPTPPPRRSVEGVPDDWLDDFVRRNPGDYHRASAAYRSNNISSQQRPPAFSGWAPQSNYANVFSDPLTSQYEQLLQAQLGLYQQQQAAMQQAAAAAEQRRAQTAEAVKRMEAYINERVGKLQGPAYTGTEAEVLRTQFLDPLERDRDAARKRALEQISARGLTPEAGVSAQLMQEVDRAFNEHRARGQGAIATRQIEEERSRSQEAQQLLQYLAQLPDAQARGDLDFVNYVQTLIANPGQQGLTVGKMLADLPSERLDDALRTLGLGGGGANTSAQMLQLLAQQQQQRQYQNALNANAWGGIGRGFF